MPQKAATLPLDTRIDPVVPRPFQLPVSNEWTTSLRMVKSQAQKPTKRGPKMQFPMK